MTPRQLRDAANHPWEGASPDEAHLRSMHFLRDGEPIPPCVESIGCEYTRLPGERDDFWAHDRTR